MRVIDQLHEEICEDIVEVLWILSARNKKTSHGFHKYRIIIFFVFYNVFYLKISK